VFAVLQDASASHLAISIQSMYSPF
jgi:hypothetical protein